MQRPLTLACILLVAVCLAAAAVCAAVAADGAPEEEWEQFRIGNETYYAMPDDVARALGLDVKSVPEGENAADLYLRAIRAMPKKPWDLEADYAAAQSAPWGPELTKLHGWFGQTAAARDLFRQAAAMERCRFPWLYWGPEEPFLFALAMPHLVSMRDGARLLVAEGHLRESEGRLAEALGSYMAAVRMGCHLGTHGTLIQGLVAIAAQKIGRGPIRDALARHDVPAEILADLAQELEETGRTLPGRTAWVQSERADFKQLAGLPVADLISLGGDAPESEAVRAMLNSRAFRIVFPDRTLQADADRVFDAIAELTRLPTWEAASTYRDGADVLVTRYTKDWNVLQMSLLPAVPRAGLAHIGGVCEHSALRLDVALRRYRLDHAAYPEDLGALVPDYIEELPVDPYSGGQFHYRRAGDGWSLHAVGPDQEDDGGVHDPEDEALDDVAFSSQLRPEEDDEW